MKKLLIFLLGVGVGIGVGKFVWGVYFGATLFHAMQMESQMPIVNNGTSAFDAYRTEDPRVAIYALRRHLAEVDGVASKFPATVKDTEFVGMLVRRDLIRARILLNGRLALLYQKTGDAQLATKHLTEAKGLLLANTGRDKLLPASATDEALFQFVEDRDKASAAW